jgi:hypothetical protein
LNGQQQPTTNANALAGMLDQNTLAQLAQQILTTGLLGISGLGGLGIANPLAVNPLAALPPPPPMSNNPQAVMNNTAILSQLAAQAKIDGPITNRLYVSGLDFKVDEKQLREVYSVAGNVTNVYIFRDKDTNRSLGRASVELETAFEALNAISMLNRHVLHDRVMHVKFDARGGDDEAMMNNKQSGYNGGKMISPNAQPQQKLPVGLKSIGSGIMPMGGLNMPMQPSLLPNPPGMIMGGQPGFAAADLASLAGLGFNPSSLGILF